MQAYDTIEKHKGCIIQHGKCNDRIYLMKIHPSASSNIPKELINLAKENKYSKIFAKVPETKSDHFYNAGFVKEAEILNFFSGETNAVFFGYYLNEERSNEAEVDKLQEILQIALKKEVLNQALNLEDKFIMRKCEKSDVNSMAEIYKKVFPSYPFPIHEPDYLLETMQSHIDYFCIETEGKIIALSSAELDLIAQNAEMTDFAALPSWRGNRLSQHLLSLMEDEVKKKNIKTAYTIARAVSPGMNVTFRKAGYEFGGRLKNNTNISGNIESMNVWYKSLK